MHEFTVTGITTEGEEIVELIIAGNADSAKDAFFAIIPEFITFSSITVEGP